MSTKFDFLLKLLVYQKQQELSFFKNVAEHKVFFSPIIYSWSSGARSFLSRNIISLIESLVHVTTQCVLLCVVLAIWKINKKLGFFFNCKSGIVVLKIYIRTLFYFKIEKKK